MPWLLALPLALFVAVLAALESGRTIALRRHRDVKAESTGFGPIEAAIYGLMGLLIAFTFSGAASRFDAHRNLITTEANAIGSAYMRLDLLPAAARPQLRTDLRAYVDARFAYYRDISSSEATAEQDRLRAAALQRAIWSHAVAAVASADTSTRTLVISSIDEAFSVATIRDVALETHPPLVIYGVLIGLVLVSTLFAGFGMASGGKRSWLHMLVYAAVLSSTVYVIIDLELPRSGLIRADRADQVLIDQRNSMN